jgi:hypothetical protein
MESRFGHDFGNVRVHTDARAAESAHQVHALAYTVGSDIVFGANQYAPNTDGGQRLLAHELTHTIQQGDGVQTMSDGLSVSDPDDALEREADAVANSVQGRAMAVVQRRIAPLVLRVKEPYISKVSVNLTAPESASLEWRGTPPTEPGSDSFTVSTGKGYSNPEDPAGTCNRGCCSGADTQCAPPFDEPKRIGSCCTPISDGFWTGTPRKEQNGWLYWTPVEPIHTAGGRGIALHQHDEVTGNAIGHGCIRMDEANAHRIFLYSRGKATNVTITGRATVDCPADRQCSAPSGGSRGDITPTGLEPDTAIALTRPDQEAPGGGGAPADQSARLPEDEEALI